MFVGIGFRYTYRLLPFDLQCEGMIFSVGNVRSLAAGAFTRRANASTFAYKMGYYHYAHQTKASSWCIVDVALIRLFYHAFFHTDVGFNGSFDRHRTTLAGLFPICRRYQGTRRITVNSFILRNTTIGYDILSTQIRCTRRIRHLRRIQTIITERQMVNFRFGVAIGVTGLLRRELHFFQQVAANPRRHRCRQNRLITRQKTYGA